MKNDSREFKNEDRVLVFDPRLYKDDKSTPLNTTMRPATIVQRYGEIGRQTEWGAEQSWNYPDLVAVRFDHRPNEVSYGHFTTLIKEI